MMGALVRRRGSYARVRLVGVLDAKAFKESREEEIRRVLGSPTEDAGAVRHGRNRITSSQCCQKANDFAVHAMESGHTVSDPQKITQKLRFPYGPQREFADGEFIIEDGVSDAVTKIPQVN